MEPFILCALTGLLLGVPGNCMALAPAEVAALEGTALTERASCASGCFLLPASLVQQRSRCVSDLKLDQLEHFGLYFKFKSIIRWDASRWEIVSD